MIGLLSALDDRQRREVDLIILFYANSRSQGSLSGTQDGADGEASLSKMDIVLSFTLEVLNCAPLILHWVDLLEMD